MTLQIFSLICVVIIFTGLFAWVFWPSNRDRLEAKGLLALDDETAEQRRQARKGDAS